MNGRKGMGRKDEGERRRREGGRIVSEGWCPLN
jgi:hypothetical protein